MSMNSDEFTHNVVVQEEIDRMKAAAPDYRVGTTCEFRTIISNACRDTYFGRRSISNFAEVAIQMIKQQDELEQFEIPVKDLYFNSIKTWESQWEVLRESQTKTPEKAAKYKKLTENLAGMINKLLEAGVITTGDCKINLTVQLMFECGIINNVKLFERRLVRLNTAMLYKQDKYNLVREVGEGYASLFNELTNASIDNARDSKGKLESTPMERIPQFLKTITSHMGVFHLDPNRVLDIILDLFIRQLRVNYKFWIALIKESEWVKSLVHTDLNGEVVTNPSPIMAQLFGFRFHSYHNEDTEPTPKEIYFAIAILLANELILIGDILPYLHPYHEGMSVEKKEYIEHMNKEINTNSGGQLAMYGALGETEGSTVRVKRQKQDDEAEEKEEDAKKKYEQNDVVELVRALLSIGDLKHAQMVLAEYEKLVDLYPELAYDIYRLCSIVLDPAYETFVPEETKKLYSHFQECADQSQIKTALSTQDDPNPKVPDQTKLKRVLVFDALLDNTKDIIKRERYVFFYRNTRDGLDLCTEPEHLMSRFLPLARLAGYKSYLCTELVQKVMLIVGGLVERESEFPNSRIYCINLLREFLLPSIAFSQGNPGTMASVWEILCRFTFQERYALYGEWHADFYKKTIETKLLKVRTERSIREVMRCVNKNNVRPSGRDLGKLAHSNPTLVFHHMLDQVQQFENLAPLMAEACRYYGDFAYDVLGFVLTEKWTGSQGAGRTLKEKEKDDGFAHLWFRSLAIFTGMLFKKQDMEATPLLRYLACRLRYDDSVSDLHLLNEFVTKMGGIEILASALTDDQIAAASCSETIKNEAFLPVSSDNRRASRRVLSRLKDSLRKNNIGFEILVLLHRLDEVCSAELGVPAAVRCHKLDHVHQSQIQYFELLTSLFEGDEYSSIMPEPKALIEDYQLPLDVVMNFTRPKTQHTIRNNIEEPIVEGEIWTPFKSLCEDVSSALPEPPLGTIFSAEFFVVFWQLTLYDIYCPEEPYEAGIKRETDTIRKCQDTRSQFYLNNRPSVVLKTQRQAQLRLDQLREDLVKHKSHVEKIMAVLKDSKSRWFPSLNQRQAQISSIMQYCLLPRSRQSEVDAAFCYEFSMLMHRINTPNFSSLTLFDKMLSDNLPASFLAFSEYETTVYSRFIFKALSRMQQWHTDEKLFVKEAHGNNLIGFQKNWNSTPTPIAKEDLLSFADFQRVLHKWHFKSDLVIEQALKSGEVVVMKNAFMVLRQFAPCFPAVADHGNSIMKIVKKLAEEDERGNIKVLARSYMGLIAKYKTKWISKEAFLGLKQPSPPVEIKIAPPSTSNTASNAKEANGTSASNAKDKPSSSSHHYDSSGHRREESSSKRRDETAAAEPKSSRPVSPSANRRGDDAGRSKSSQRAASPSKPSSPPSSSDRKRTREAEPSSSSRAEKMARVEESSSRHHHRSSSRRESPRDSASSSRINTPIRNDVARSSRAEPVSSTAAVASTTTVVQVASRSSAHRESTRANEERSSRSTRNPESSSSRVISSNHVSSSHVNQSSVSATSSKRPVDIDSRDRVREERPEKRRDVREESRTVRDSASAAAAPVPASSTSRSRLDDGRRDDRMRERRVDDRRTDDRRMDDRRADDRRLDDRRVEERRMDDRRMDERRIEDRRMDERRMDDRRRERDRDREHRHRRR